MKEIAQIGARLFVPCLGPEKIRDLPARERRLRVERQIRQQKRQTLGVKRLRLPPAVSDAKPAEKLDFQNGWLHGFWMVDSVKALLMFNITQNSASRAV
ncbi:MAG: hypothetical protein PGMFKBFP_02950 [Anaerolineales bacterium]|nr:hypothetical protein [Anaerolineales bacterium]